jgi:hypothetical protein
MHTTRFYIGDVGANGDEEIDDDSEFRMAYTRGAGRKLKLAELPQPCLFVSAFWIERFYYGAGLLPLPRL